jgi:asparagine synthase (glutamine-hydrolysing)
MGYHYIALVQTAPLDSAPRMSEAQSAFLRARGLRPCTTNSPFTLFVSSETPVFTVPCGVVLGHLFCKDGTPAKPDAMPALASAEQFASHLLTRYWGEYLLIQSTTEPAPRLDVLREPSGGVSCLYSLQSGTGFITSDISLAIGLGLYRRQIDWDFITQALAHPHVKTARTGLTGIRELLPGCSLILSSACATVRQNWSPWTFVASPRRHHDPHEAAAEIRTTVTSAIKAWAETDKAILMELSGGLDSSIVATCLHSTDSRVTYCTFVTPVPGADERQYARQVTDALGVALHAEELGFENARFDFIPATSTATPRLGILQHVSQEVMAGAAQTHRAASFFSGGGGDSVFCFLRNAAPAADAFQEKGPSAGFATIQNLSVLHQCTHWKAGRLTLKKLLHGAKPPYAANRSFLSSALTIVSPEPHPWLAAPRGALSGDRERIADLAGTQVFRDSAPRGFTHRLRLPLLSQPVMEACLKVPSWMWITGGQDRAIARAAFADQLPQGVLERRSKGTFMNYLGAIYQRERLRMREYLLTGHLQEHHLLDVSALEEFFDAIPPRDTAFTRVFDLCMIESWLRHQR